MHMKLGRRYVEEAFLFRITNIDRKHDVYISQQVFPVKK